MKKFNLAITAFFMLILTSCASTKPSTDSGDAYVDIHTSKGVITVQLFSDVPKHSQNFLKLAGEGYYDSTLFHRVISGFMIQGGDPDSKDAEPGARLGNGDIGYRIPAEFDSNHVHTRGALAAARTNNPEKESSGCQFYIVQGKTLTADELSNFEKRAGITYTEEQKKIYMEEGGTPFLDMNYTVYGQVVSGMDVVDAIAAVQKDGADRPKVDVNMWMHVLTDKEIKKRFK